MAMGQQKDRQGDLMVSWSEMPRSPGHVFYDRLQLVLIEGGFDGFAEAVCQPYYAARMGAPSVPPGRYFRMHLVGYFEGIGEWRQRIPCRTGLLLEMRERVPDHSWRHGPARSQSPRRVLEGERICLDSWRPTRRCATSCGATRARVTGGCWSAWPRRAV